MSLWGGRFNQINNKSFKKFNDSLKFDYKLVEQDIISSISWSKALLSIDVITIEEQTILEDTLKKLLNKVNSKKINILESDAEDIHTWVEQQLINEIGILGKKLHTGRSRNDQVATDLKLWCKKTINEIIFSINNLQKQLVFVANENQNVIIPGYTHLQRAQPITFSHWCLAYFEMFERDILRLKNTLTLLDVCPLGSGSLAGTSYKINRDLLARDLGFKTATINSLDAVSDRDYVLELLSNASISANHLSRFAEDLIIYNSGEFNFIELSDNVTSGSSLMPQKKNPDALELIRGKTGRITGALMSLLMTFKALPLAYNKDMQEDKETLFTAIETWKDCLDMASLVLNDIKINADICEQHAKKGYANATELADYLVTKGIAFREAHHIVGKIVLYAISEKLLLENITLENFKNFSSLIDEDVYDILSLVSCLEKRNVKGGVAKNQVSMQIDAALDKLNKI